MKQSLKFQNPSTGETIETADKADIKKYKACGWKQIKTPKVYYVNGLKNGDVFSK